MCELGNVDELTDLLETHNITCGIFSGTVPEPTESSVMSALSYLRSGAPDGQDYDCIIALGGGSPIDSAKAISVLGTHGGVIRDYKFPNQAERPGLPVIAVPTTAGTGSESTRFTIITDDMSESEESVEEKMLCGGFGFMPLAAISDYELTLSVPARTTADTGIDALTHAIESYVSQKANPFSDQQALAAMRLIGPNLRSVYHQPDNRAARESMMLGATIAGSAFSNASVALVHGMSRPIGAFFHVPHGLSNAMLLPTVTEFSVNQAYARYADCARETGLASGAEDDQSAVDRLVSELKELNRELEVPSPKDYGIDEAAYFDALPTMADQALTSGSPGNNPRVPSKDEIVTLYSEIWRRVA